MSIILEPVADNMEKVMEVKSTSDMLGHIEDMNDATEKKEKIKNTETNKEDNSKNKKTQVPEPGHSQNDLNKNLPSHGSPAQKGGLPLVMEQKMRKMMKNKNELNIRTRY